MKAVLTNRKFLRIVLINMFFGMTEALFALRTIFMSSKGLTPTQIGVAFSISNILGTLSPLMGGALADRFFSRYKVFVVSIIGYGLVVALLPVAGGLRIGGLLLAMALIPSLQLFHPIGSTMIATCTINATFSPEAEGVDYSMFRIWMSVGYTLANFCYTPIMKHLGVNAPFFVALAFFAALLALRASVKDFETVPESARVDKRRLNFRGIVGNYYIMTFVIINMLYAAAANCSTYLSYVLEEHRIDPSQIGTVAGVKVVGEVIILLLIPRIKRVFSLSGFQLVAGLFLCTELALMQFARDLVPIALVEMIGGLGQGISLCTAALYVRVMAPRGLEATAHSLWSMGTSLGGIILSYVFGRVVEAHGVLANYRLALGLQVTWLLLFLGTLLFGHYVLRRRNVVPMFFAGRKE